jgi:glycosyltransferase involved in cell wall biosynthesis
MRIAILHYAGPPIIGGVEHTMAVHSRLFIEHGHSVSVIAGRGEKFRDDVDFVHIPEVDSRHPEVLAIGEALAAGEVPPTFYDLRDRLVERLSAAMQGHDACIAHNVLTLHKNLPLTAALYNLTHRATAEVAPTQSPGVIGWCHDFAWVRPQYQPVLHEGYPWNLLSHPWPGVRYVVVSEAQRTELARLFAVSQDQITVVPPGVELAEFDQWTETTRRLVAELDLLAANPLLLLPARITRRKNIELAIRITAALKAAGRQPKLVVTGPPGPHNPKNAAYLDALRDLRRELDVIDAVIFVYEVGADGRSPLQVDDTTVANLFHLADSLLFPSTAEGFGIPVLEAGMARLPIFCSDIPPFRETANGAAEFFRLDEPPATIARRIVITLDADRASRLRRRVLHEYTWEAIFVQRIEPLLRES